MTKMTMIQFGDKTYPAAITNYSLSMGHKLGFLNGSQYIDILNNVDMLHVIYLSLIGPNKHLDISYNEFLKGDWSDEKIEEVYRKIILSVTNIPENNFAKEIIKHISHTSSNNQTAVKPLKLNFECVEDRYVIYCLVYGIDCDTFWHAPIMDVERIFESIKAYRSWESNPR